MAAPLSIRTERLHLIAATLPHVLAEYEGNDALAAILNVAVPASWPPGEYDRDALDFFRSKLESSGPDQQGWYNWYVMPTPGELRDSTLVGGAGYLGPPSADGVVEIGYSVVPEARGRGYATEIVEGLVRNAFAKESVRIVIAHTADDNAVSSSVLQRCGFRSAGAGEQPGTTRYERARSDSV